MSQSLKETLIRLEKELLLPEVRASRAELDARLADDFLEIPSTGIPYDKDHALRRIPDEQTPEFTSSDYTLKVIGKDTALLTYRATIRRPGSQKRSYSMRASLYRRCGESWQMVFHQGTPCPPWDS